MKRLISIIAFIGLLLMTGVAQAAPVDCSGLPKSHTVTIGIKSTAGDVVKTPQATVEVTDALLMDSAYTYDFTEEVAGTTYVIQCLDATDATYNFTFTLSGRETFVNASVKSITDKLPTNYIMGSSVQTAKDDEIDDILTDTGTTIPGTIVTVQADLDNPTQYKATGFSTHSAADVKTAIEAGGSSIALILEDTGTTIPATIVTVQADLDNPTQYMANVAGMALDATVAKEATLANATYGLSALQVLLDAIATSTELTAMFDTIKGVGWTTQTLVAIQAAIESSGLSAQQVRDAMKLAPTAGASATDSIDDKIDGIEGGTTPEAVWSYATRKLSSRNIGAGEDIAREQTLTGTISSGVLQSMVTVTDSTTQTIIRGDVKTFTFNLGTGWNLTGKKVYFIAKDRPTSSNTTAIVNRVCTVTDAVNGVATITLTADETNKSGTYYAEAEVRDTDDTNPQTAKQFTLKISQDVRQ